MSELYRRLISVLAHELIVFRDLEGLLNQEKDVITEWDASKLEDLASRKLKLQNQLRPLEKQRKATVAELAGTLNLENKTPSLRILAEHAPTDSREQIEKIRTIFKKLSEGISRQVEDNNQRLNHSLRIVHNLRSLILKQVEEPVTYEKAGSEPLKKNDLRMKRGRRV